MPEHNLIQRPDLLLRVQQFFGLRQMHVSPTLNEGVHLVTIVADLTKETPSTTQERNPIYRSGAALGGAAVGAANSFKVRLPAGATRRVELLRARISMGTAGGDVIVGVQNETADFLTVDVGAYINGDVYTKGPTGNPAAPTGSAVFSYRQGAVVVPAQAMRLNQADYGAINPADLDLSGYVLFPGQEFVMAGAVFNTQVNLHFVTWREVQLPNVA
jgi:hypothetical protein